MTRTPHAGNLDQLITFQARAAGKDGYGQANGVWADVATDPTVWAQSAFITGRDVAVAGQYQATLDAKFVLRYRADILPTWRVMWNGQPFEILGEPSPMDGGREWIELRCTKGVRDGR